MLYPFFILCLQRKETVLTLAVPLTLNFLWDCSFLEEIMQLFWGTCLSPFPGRRCSTFQAVPVVKSVPSGGC